jgi:phage terminase Nu1 subunit (DNA packaging protein)
MPRPSWAGLAIQLGVPQSTISNWRSQGAPREIDYEAWVEWCDQNGKNIGVTGDSDGVASDQKLPGKCPYDAIVRIPVRTYVLAAQREKARNAFLQNEKAQLELKQMQGKLVERKTMQQALYNLRDKIGDRLANIPQIVCKRLNVSIDAKQQITKVIESEIAEALNFAKDNPGA